MAPAIRLADSGFTVDRAFEESIRGNAERIAPFAGAAVFMPNGHPLAAGTMFRQPALASTLRAIAAHGRGGFYTGPVADAIAAEMQRGGGIITKDDLARYASAVARAAERHVSRLHAAHDAAFVIGRHHGASKRSTFSSSSGRPGPGAR